MTKLTQRQTSAFNEGRIYGTKLRKDPSLHTKSHVAKRISKIFKMMWLLGCDAGLSGDISNTAKKRKLKLSLAKRRKLK